MSEKTEGTFGYPSHEIPNSEKDKDWIYDFVRSAYREIQAVQFNVFHGKRHVYSEVREHAQGNMSVNRYKKQLGIDEGDDSSWYAIHWKPLAILPRLRRMALSSMSKRRYDVTLNTIDPRITKEDHDHLQRVESKLKLKEGLSKVDPELASSPILQAQGGEPEDIFGFETYKSFGYKHNLVEGFERANRIVLNDNNYEEELRDQLDEQSMDYGAHVLKQTLDERGRIELEVVDVPNFISSYFRRPDGKDARFMGQFKPLTFGEIRSRAGTDLNKTQVKKLLKMVAGKHGNPAAYPDMYPQSSNNMSAYDSYKIPVMELEFRSINFMTYETRVDKRGNSITRPFKGEESEKKSKNKYEKIPYQVIYKATWVIHSDIMIDYGLCTNQPKGPDTLHEANYSFKPQVFNMHDMTVISKMEECITPNHMIQIAWFKMQNEIATAVPNGWYIDRDALEDLTFGEGKGAETWNSKSLLDMFFQRGVLIGKRKTHQGKIDPNKPVEPMINDSMAGVEKQMNIIQQNIQLMRQILGVNEYVDGSNIDSRTLKNVTEMAQESMNNSLHDIVSMERKTLHKITGENVLRIQDLIEMDALHDSYRKALGEATVAMLESVDDLCSYKLNVEIDFMPTDMDRQIMLQRLSQYSATGLVDPSDEYLIMTATSMKVAWAILDSRVRQRKEEKRRESLDLMKQNAKAGAEAGVAVEQAKQQTLMTKGEIERMVQEMITQREIQKEHISGQYGVESASIRTRKD